MLRVRLLTKTCMDDRMDSTRSRVSQIDKDGNLVAQAAKIKSKTGKHNGKIVVRYINLGYYLLVPLIGGVFIGVELDKWLGTKPIFTVVFILLGTLAIFYNLVKLLRHA